jgi:hypothetical protein
MDKLEELEDKLKESMTGKIIKGILNGEQVSEQWINVNDALLIAQNYGYEVKKWIEEHTTPKQKEEVIAPNIRTFIDGIEDRFYKALMGIHDYKSVEEIPPMVNSLLYHCYQRMKSYGCQNQELILKYCCVELNDQINKDLQEKFTAKLTEVPKPLPKV